jgi:drug/metabolite transporter (DMT)-like permease
MIEHRESQNAIKSENIFISGMLVSMFFWGVSWTTAKVISGYAPALSIAFIRFVITSITMVLILYFSKTNLKLMASKESFFVLGGASICMSVYSLLFFLGLSHGEAGAAAVLVTMLNPIISYVIMLFISRRKPNSIEMIGLLLGLIAAIFLLKVWENAALVFSSGNIFFLASSFTWAILSLFTARSSKYGSPIAFSFWMYSIGAMLLLPFAQVFSLAKIMAHADLKFWLNLLITACISTAMATSFYFYATTKIGASKASSFIFLVPFSAMLNSWFFLNETPRWNTLFGASIGVGAVYILNKKQS